MSLCQKCFVDVGCSCALNVNLLCINCAPKNSHIQKNVVVSNNIKTNNNIKNKTPKLGYQ
jgi:hypothetical protein